MCVPPLPSLSPLSLTKTMPQDLGIDHPDQAYILISPLIDNDYEESIWQIMLLFQVLGSHNYSFDSIQSTLVYGYRRRILLHIGEGGI